MDEDIVGELQACVSARELGFTAVPTKLIDRVIKRIKFLRSHAGAVTEGQSHEDIQQSVKGGERPPFDRPF